MFGNPGSKSGLPWHQLTMPTTKNIAHDYQIKFSAVNLSSFDGSGQDGTCQLGRGEALEGPTEPADR
jgi:hypothetical protein